MKYLLVLCLVAAIAAMEEPSKRSGYTCVPGQIKQGLCGPCKCNDEGTSEICENTSCLPNGRNDHDAIRRILRAGNDHCIPGHVFHMGCNTCRCLKSGRKSQAACTAAACRRSRLFRRYGRF